MLYSIITTIVIKLFACNFQSVTAYEVFSSYFHLSGFYGYW